MPPGSLPESIKSEDLHRPEDARYEDPGVEDGRLHLRRTLRKARLTMAEASAEECKPAAGCARSSATSTLVSGLTGRMSRPLSPRSNTLRARHAPTPRADTTPAEIPSGAYSSRSSSLSSWVIFYYLTAVMQLPSLGGSAVHLDTTIRSCAGREGQKFPPCGMVRPLVWLAAHFKIDPVLPPFSAPIKRHFEVVDQLHAIIFSDEYRRPAPNAKASFKGFTSDPASSLRTEMGPLLVVQQEREYEFFNCRVKLGPVQTQFTEMKLVRQLPVKEPGWVELELVGTQSSEYIVWHKGVVYERLPLNQSTAQTPLKSPSP